MPQKHDGHFVFLLLRVYLAQGKGCSEQGKCMKLVYQLAITSPACKMMTETLMR